MRIWDIIQRTVFYGAMACVLSAGAPLTSPRPVFRAPPENLSTDHPSTRAQEAGLGVILQNLFRPAPRRTSELAIAEAVAAATLQSSFDPNLATAVSPRPILRPSNLASAASVQPPPANSGTRRGSVCGERQIRGVQIAAIAGRVAGCGQSNPVRVSSVSGIRLTQDAIMDCNTAKTLNSWVREGVIPAIGRRGRGLEAVHVIAHYSCRTRNNQPGARISEHGKGHAIDIAGFILKNGDEITVLDGWDQRREGRILREIYRAACGPFGTVLGPDANRQHKDHFHVDTAQYSGGSYCR